MIQATAMLAAAMATEHIQGSSRSGAEAEQAGPSAAQGPTATTIPGRRVSIDAYRGLVMLLMMAEVLALGQVARALPESRFWAFLARQQTHAEWVGCTVHDLIQPSFSFLVGVALPFSIAARLARGQSKRRMWVHAVVRALVLVWLGIFLRSVGRPSTNFTFEDTLTQIGLGYVALFALAQRSPKTQGIALAGILIGYWLLFALWPLPGPEFDWKRAGVAPDWPHQLTGFAAHWNKNTNPAWAFDTWFLNLFPRPRPFTHNAGGYATLNFIPTLGTMILGLLAGGWLRAGLAPAQTLRRLVGAGLLGLASGWALGALGLCPVVKRIWTPSWVLFSGGWCFVLLAAFYLVTEVWGWQRWAYGLVVIGANSITAYCMAHLTVDFIRSSLRTHLGERFFLLLGEPYRPLVAGLSILLVEWLILWWLYRRRIFIKI